MFNRKSLICTFLMGLFGSLGMNAQVIDGAEITVVNFPHSTNYFTALSDNGEWAVAAGVSEENETVSAYPYLVNAKTGQLTMLWSGSDATGYSAGDVTNSGNVVGGTPAGPAYYDLESRTWVQLPGSGSPTCVTPDGKYIGGFAMGGAAGDGQSNETPVMWELQDDGTYRQIDVYAELTKFPNRDKNGYLTAMVRINNISADGNLIAGHMNFVYMGQGCYYVYNRTTHETVYVDNLMPEGTHQSGAFIDASNMSNDGSYMTGQAYVVETGGSEYNTTYKMNLTDNSLELYNTYSDEQDRAGFAVSNAGTVFASSPALNPLRYMYIRSGKLWFGLDEIMTGRYGVNIYDKIGQECTGYAVDVSDDEKTLLAMSMATGNGYIIRLPETFAEAASHIDPFAEGTYVVTPSAGTAFARYRRGTIQFSKPTSLKANAKGTLLDKNGGTVSTVNITAMADGVSFNLSALPVALTPGEEYTLYIPAGTFTLSADDSYQSKDIRISYIGRENTPAKVVAVSPTDGNNVNEISTDQPVRIQFDINVQAGTDEDGRQLTGYLYEGDNETPICELIITTNDNMVGLAPALPRYLRKDIDYRVVLPKDAITDIMGDCGNEEYSITYHGVYEPEPDPMGNLFFDDFDDPSVSMATYLLYENDHRTPMLEQQNWGFDADNNPWNFTLRDTNEDTDYFAASHSMYNPAGQSDDWMSLPQLYIENADYYLNFNAQNFSTTKKDVLKVYVLEADEVYNTFTNDLFERFNNEGKVVFDEQLTFGKQASIVGTDWTDDTKYEVSLADYAGKNIYIAFVNQNDNQSVIFLDSVRVYYRGDFVLNSTTEQNVVNRSSIKVTGQVNITGDDTYNDITATVTAGDWSSTVSAEDLGLTKDSPAYTFEFPDEMPLLPGENNDYVISVTVDGNNLSRSGSVRNLLFETTKRMIVEEGTGQWCGNCPLGVLAFDNLETYFGDKVIPMAVHGGGTDVFAYQDYCDYLGFGSYPTGRVNRIDSLYVPALSMNIIEGDDIVNKYSFTSTTGNKTFYDIVQREFTQNPYAEADITVTGATYDAANRMISVEGNVNYAVNLDAVNSNILFVVLENGLSGEQENYFYSNSDPLFGEFGQGGIYASSRPTIPFDHVVRRVIGGSFSGTSGIVPGAVKAGEPVQFTVKNAIYDNVSNWANAEIVAILIDNNSGLVVNAVKAPFTAGTVGISSVTADNGEDISIAVNGSNVNVNAAGEVNVTVYDVNGTLVGKAGGQGSVSVPTNGKGLYIVKATAGGASVVKKVAIR